MAGSRPSTAMSLLGEGKRVAKQQRSLLKRLRSSYSFEASSTSSTANLGAMMVGGAIPQRPLPKPVTVFRCDVYGNDGSDFINAIEECQQLVREEGGSVLQEYQGGFVYDMVKAGNTNPLEDKEPTELGGYINIEPWGKGRVASYKPPAPPVPPKHPARSVGRQAPVTPMQRKRTGSSAREKAGKLMERIKKRMRRPQVVEESMGDRAIDATGMAYDGPAQGTEGQEEQVDATDASSVAAVSAFTREPSAVTLEDPAIYVSPRHCRRCSDAGSEASNDTRGSIDSSNYDWESAVVETAQVAVYYPAGSVRVVDIPRRRQAPPQQE